MEDSSRKINYSAKDLEANETDVKEDMSVEEIENLTSSGNSRNDLLELKNCSNLKSDKMYQWTEHLTAGEIN